MKELNANGGVGSVNEQNDDIADDDERARLLRNGSK